MRSLLLVAVSAFASIAAGAAPYIQVHNNCGYSLEVGQSKNGDQYGTSVHVPAGGDHTFTFAEHWAGRVWGRKKCTGQDCTFAGMWNPATLAEVKFQDNQGKDYYDISLVDGYNEPMSLAPINGNAKEVNGDKHCGTVVCPKGPACPPELQLKDNTGAVIGCESACSKFREPKYCCTGAFNQQTCKPTNYSKLFKAACPTSYSYAYDDATSTYMCVAPGYRVVFCPK